MTSTISMNAVVFDRYGPPGVLRLESVERPVPGEHDLLVRVHAASVTRTDAGYRAAHPFIVRFWMGLLAPKRRILGGEFAGIVESAGSAVTQFSPGDRVFGSTGFALGAHAEYVRVRESGHVARIPTGVSFEEAAAVCEGALYALVTLRGVGITAGQRVLVYGASGAIGSASVQLAKHFGAHVTAVCSTRNLDVVRSLGPDRVIDYTQEDFTRTHDTYHVIHDAVGKHSFRRCRRALEPDGVYATNDLGYLWHVPLLALLTAGSRGKRARIPLGPPTTPEDVCLLARLLEEGKFRPVVDRTYPVEQVVEAATYVDTGRKTGNVVITFK